MGSKMQTGLLLVIGTILAGIGWMVLYPGDPSDGAAATAQHAPSSGRAQQLSSVALYHTVPYCTVLYHTVVCIYISGSRFTQK